MKWRKGDLGRFESEDRNLPRFEVIRAVKDEHVEVWYGGTDKTTLVPWSIFFKECTNLWNWKLDVTIPPWLAPGREFTAMGSFKQALIKYSVGHHIGHKVFYGTSEHEHLYEADNARLLVRNIRHDHASCLVLPEGPLVLVSIEDAVRFRRTTAWSRLLDTNDIFEEEVDDLAEIFG